MLQNTERSDQVKPAGVNDNATDHSGSINWDTLGELVNHATSYMLCQNNQLVHSMKDTITNAVVSNNCD